MLTNHHNADTYGHLMQGKVSFEENSPTPKLVWNQIKIVIAANQDGNERASGKFSSFDSSILLPLFAEFDVERDLLLTETLPKLQQYFLTQGVSIYFVDCHLNGEFDWTSNPYHVQRLLKELHDAHRTSA